MKTIYKITWSVFVKDTYDVGNSKWETREAFIENKADATEFKRKIDAAFALLEIPKPMSGSSITEIPLK
jgi:hypothetical protein